MNGSRECIDEMLRKQLTRRRANRISTRALQSIYTRNIASLTDGDSVCRPGGLKIEPWSNVDNLRSGEGGGGPQTFRIKCLREKPVESGAHLASDGFGEADIEACLLDDGDVRRQDVGGGTHGSRGKLAMQAIEMKDLLVHFRGGGLRLS